MARTLGAPEREFPPGKVSINVPTVSFRIKLSAHSRSEMYHMTIILRFFIKQNIHIMTIPAEIISCQIDQHHMFGILFRIGKKRFGKLPCLCKYLPVRRVVPAIGSMYALPFSILQCVSGEDPNIRYPRNRNKTNKETD